ncbi:MAG: DUF2723 domain-containing protein [Rubrobacter sp.]|jgi:hypothetical protein|nr:DUF2723 domain-containing protein [Rubrobacter sp.]
MSSVEKFVRFRGGGVSLGAVGVGIAAFVMYFATLTPTVLDYDAEHLKDAAVFQAVAALPGVPDYTGYPTYAMLGHLFTYLPFGDVAYRVNLASAVYGAVAVALVFLIAHRITGRISASVAGAAAFALGPTFWGQTAIAGVYTLNAMLVSLVVFTLLVWRDTRKDGHLLLAAFLMGISLTNHITSGLLLPAAAVFVGLVDWRTVSRVGLVLKGAGCFLLGLLPYLYIPIRASMDYLPEGFTPWGPPALRENPPNTLGGFVELVTGGHWTGSMFVFGVGDFPGRFEIYITYLYGEEGQFGVLLALLGFAGFCVFALRDRAAAALLGFLFLGWLAFSLQYNIDDIYLYFIPTYLMLGVFMAVGFASLLDAAERLFGAVGSSARMAFTAVLSVAVMGMPFAGAGETFRAVDRSGDFAGREVIETVEREVGPDAAVMHHRSPLFYMVLIENRREDIELVSHVENRASIAGALSTLGEGRPVYKLFPGSEDTHYFRGVESARAVYAEYGYELVEVAEDIRLYEVVRAEGRFLGHEIIP